MTDGQLWKLWIPDCLPASFEALSCRA